MPAASRARSIRFAEDPLKALSIVPPVVAHHQASLIRKSGAIPHVSVTMTGVPAATASAGRIPKVFILRRKHEKHPHLYRPPTWRRQKPDR